MPFIHSFINVIVYISFCLLCRIVNFQDTLAHFYSQIRKVGSACWMWLCTTISACHLPSHHIRQKQLLLIFFYSWLTSQLLSFSYPDWIHLWLSGRVGVMVFNVTLYNTKFTSSCTIHQTQKSFATPYMSPLIDGTCCLCLTKHFLIIINALLRA